MKLMQRRMVYAYICPLHNKAVHSMVIHGGHSETEARPFCTLYTILFNRYENLLPLISKFANNMANKKNCLKPLLIQMGYVAIVV